MPTGAASLLTEAVTLNGHSRFYATEVPDFTRKA